MSMPSGIVKQKKYQNIFFAFERGIIDQQDAVRRIEKHTNPKHTEGVSLIFERWIRQSKVPAFELMKAHFKKKEISYKSYETSINSALEIGNLKAMEVLTLQLLEETASKEDMILLAKRAQILKRVPRSGYSLQIMHKLLLNLTKIANLHKLFTLVPADQYQSNHIFKLLNEIVKGLLIAAPVKEIRDSAEKIFGMILSFAAPILPKVRIQKLFLSLLKEETLSFADAMIKQNLFTDAALLEMIKKYLMISGDYPRTMSEKMMRFLFEVVVERSSDISSDRKEDLLDLLLLSASWQNYGQLQEDIAAKKERKLIPLKFQKIAAHLFTCSCNLNNPTLMENKKWLDKLDVEQRNLAVITSFLEYGFLEKLANEEYYDALSDALSEEHFSIAEYILNNKTLYSKISCHTLMDLRLSLFSSTKDSRQILDLLKLRAQENINSHFLQYITGVHHMHSPDEPSDVIGAIKFLNGSDRKYVSCETLLEALNHVWFNEDKSFPVNHPFCNLLEKRLLKAIAASLSAWIARTISESHSVSVPASLRERMDNELASKLETLFKERKTKPTIFDLRNTMYVNINYIIRASRRINQRERERNEDAIPQEVLDASREQFLQEEERRRSEQNTSQNNSQEVESQSQASSNRVSNPQDQLSEESPRDAAWRRRLSEAISQSIAAEPVQGDDSLTTSFSIGLNFSDDTDSDDDSSSSD